MPLVPGARLGPYELTSLLGSGGMGDEQQSSVVSRQSSVVSRVFSHEGCRLATATEDLTLETDDCAPRPLKTGTRIGPYEVIASLGAGGMGEVFRARDTKLNRDVALKVLPEVFTADPDRLARFKREAQLLA